MAQPIASEASSCRLVTDITPGLGEPEAASLWTRLARLSLPPASLLEQAIIAEPSEQSIRALRSRTTAIWAAVERACEREDFRPNPEALCEWCSFKAYCPAWGGDPAAARGQLFDFSAA